jgi:hypothetical protein
MPRFAGTGGSAVAAVVLKRRTWAGVNRAPSAAEDLFSTTEPLQALLREADWATTPLGPVERWPDSLRAAIETVLPSRVPMMLW